MLDDLTDDEVAVLVGLVNHALDGFGIKNPPAIYGATIGYKSNQCDVRVDGLALIRKLLTEGEARGIFIKPKCFKPRTQDPFSDHEAKL